VIGGGGKSRARAVASYDEDTTTMGVEAARSALRGLPAATLPERVYFATTSPVYLDKTNAAVIHAALNLSRTALAVDLGGAPRSAVGAMVAAAESTEPALAVLADLRTGLSGGVEEIESGDGAAALLFGPGSPDAPVIAELIATAWSTDEYLDRWRTPGAATSNVWEERFGEEIAVPLAVESFTAALKRADLTPDQVDHVVVCGLAGRAVRRFRSDSGARRDAIAPDRATTIGNTGTAQPGVLLADTLDRAEPGQTIAVVVLADGAATLMFRTTDALRDVGVSRPSVAEQDSPDAPELTYATFLNWRGMLTPEPPRRPEPDAPAAPPTHRSRQFKYGFVGTRCEGCQTVHIPPVRVCYRCGAIDRMTAQPMADAPGTIATFTVDRLAYTPSPPMLAVVVDFDGGGRFRCELTDADQDSLAIGDRVELTFRRLFTTGGVHNYFWKARPARSTGTGDEQEA
jgi:3-hydroxy-3-methylglutaryl CoA synthase